MLGSAGIREEVMPKSLFAVVLTEAQEVGAARLRKAYTDSQIYPLGDNVFIVADETLTSAVAKEAALTKDQAEEGIRGVVFKLNGSYTGYTRQSLWEWLENAEGDE